LEYRLLVSESTAVCPAEVSGMNDYKVEWGREAGAAVRTVQELDELFDPLSADSIACPRIVDLISPSGRVLKIGFGGRRSVLQFSASPAPPYLVSVGKADDDGVLVFRYDGELTEVSARFAVDTEVARQAARCFLEVGDRPENVVWTEL
jgi:hypothetical protein